MIKKMLKENMDLEIEKYQGSYSRYKAKLLKINENELLITEPDPQDDFTISGIGQTIVVKFAGQLGKYYFFTRIKGSGEYGCKCFILDFPEKVYRIQRREDVRVSIEDKIIYQTQEASTGKGTGQNLSAGGIRILGPLAVEVGETVDVHLAFLSLEAIKGKVLRCDHLGEYWDISIRFLNLDNKIKEEIIRWLFIQQRQKRHD